MVPGAYVRLERLPLTPNGKLDRRSLPAPEGDAYAVLEYEAPVGEIEKVISRIWSEALGVERVGRHDNFFQLGGHSLLTVRVVSMLERENLYLLATDIFAYPTIESLAAKLESYRKGGHADKAICFRQGGSDRPLFLTHCGAGELTYLPSLTHYIDSNIPIYGLPAKPVDEAPLKTIEGMASRLVGMIREVQPVGPYRLAGWSFGGILAYEIATQLIGADQAVEFLGLFDTRYIADNNYSTEPSSVEFDDKDHLLRMIDYAISSDPTLNQSERLHSALSELRSNVGTLDFAQLLHKCQEQSLIPEHLAHLTIEQLRNNLARGHYYNLAYLRYFARPIPPPLHLFIAESNKAEAPLLGWKGVLPETQILSIPVPGTHLSMMMTPNVVTLGRLLSQAIKGGEKKTAGATCSDYSPMVPLQTGGQEAPLLFCVPGAGASVTSLVNLVGKLNKKRRIFGLEPRGLDGVLIPHSTVPSAAEFYLKAIREMRLDGPVSLFGHSFGGWVAFELANRLVESGHTVSSLTILDSEPPDDPAPDAREMDSIEVILYWVEIFDLLLQRPLGVTRRDLESSSESARMKLLHRCLVRERLIPPRSTPDLLRGPLQTFARAVRTHFSPDKSYPGRVQLVLVDDPKLDSEANQRHQKESEARWRRWAPNLVFSHAPGNHMTVLNPPHVAALALFMDKSI
jgi:thioesterase domain-containing protein